eukprot:scaffold13933_cov262-Alexandrium_tamarense.AAC.4
MHRKLGRDQVETILPVVHLIDNRNHTQVPAGRTALPTLSFAASLANHFCSTPDPRSLLRGVQSLFSSFSLLPSKLCCLPNAATLQQLRAMNS